jgi:hypothetical protein
VGIEELRRTVGYLIFGTGTLCYRAGKVWVWVGVVEVICAKTDMYLNTAVKNCIDILWKEQS